MGGKYRVAEVRALRKSVGGDVSGRHVRSRHSLPIFSAVVSLAFVLVTLTPPDGGASAMAVVAPTTSYRDVAVQQLSVNGDYAASIGRDTYTITIPVVEKPKPAPKPKRSAPAAGTPDPGTAQAIAYDMVMARGWGQDEYSCLVALWSKESGWNVYAHNSSSGAYGIPQALPGEKMASVGGDWATNPATQITWGLGYIAGRYGTPCGAWGHSGAKGWY